jgi:mevalonate kinase
MNAVAASAPAKAILFGEHAVNRGQAALAVSVGLRVRCQIRPVARGVRFVSGAHAHTCTPDDLHALAASVDGWRNTQQYAEIRALATRDFFAPAKYIVATTLRSGLAADGLDIRWESGIPPSGGLGSGGAANVALALALTGLGAAQEPGQLAYLGDVIAHGGIASALDTQTSLHGGAIRYTKEAWGTPVDCAPGLTLVIGDTGQRGETATVNGRVRDWLAADATRMRYFDMIGVLSDAARAPLAAGDWPSLGKLINMNQLVLEKIGVSTPPLERLIDAALAAGAFGAKLSGSGGGGIMLALTDATHRDAVAHAIQQAGGHPLCPGVAVDGARLENLT